MIYSNKKVCVPSCALLNRYWLANKGFFLLYALFFVLTFTVLTVRPVQAADVFTIEGVSVDVRDQSAAMARKEAHKQAQEEALRILFKKLTLFQDHARIDTVEIQDAAVYVKSIEVANERTSGYRYLADITVSFNSDSVRQFLTFNKLDYAETQSKPILILPVTADAGKISLWQETNAWAAAWKGHNESRSLVPLILPVGTLEEVRTLSAEQAINGDVNALQILAEKYKAGAIMVPYAEISESRTGPVLNLVADFYGLSGQKQTLSQSFSGAGPADLLYDQAFQATIEALEQRWKLENLISGSQSGEIIVRAPLPSLEQWVKLQKVFGKIGLIKEFHLKSFNKDYADVTIIHTGSRESLLKALRQVDLNLRRERGRWTLAANL